MSDPTIDALTTDFRVCFGSPAGQRVMHYLQRICHAAGSCVAVSGRNGPVDIYRTFINEGRREVFLEIQTFLSLTPDQIFDLAMGVVSNPKGENDDE